MRKIKQLLIAFAIMFPTFSYAQKAYESTEYKGKIKNIVIEFSLADGYISANNLYTINQKTKKRSRFLATDGVENEDKKMKFYHYSVSNKKFNDYFILENILDSYDNVPTKIYGKYYSGGVSFDVVLIKL